MEARRRRKHIIGFAIIFWSLWASNLGVHQIQKGFQTRTEIHRVIHDLRGGVSSTEVAWLLITIWMLYQQSMGFQPLRQATPPPHQQLFGGTSSSPRNNYFSKSSQPGASLQMQRPSAMPHQEYTSLTKEQRRNLPHPDDYIIPEQDVIIRNGQAKFKVKNHGSDFGFFSDPNEKDCLKTPRTFENIEGYKNEIKKLVLTGERIEGTYRKDEPDQYLAIHFYDSASGCNVIFKQETKEFVSAWKLPQGQVNDLLTHKNIGDY